MSGRETIPRVIVSLTSFPKALPFAAKSVNSILRGEVLPDKVILYLCRREMEGCDLPTELKQLVEENEKFEIHYIDSVIRSYGKLVPALREYPDDLIITIDDDVDYDPRLLGKLLETHRRYPDCIIAHRTKRIKKADPYKKWHKYHWYHFLLRRHHARYSNLLTGVGGVLYPPHSLKEEMMHEDLFEALAPSADDFWFWAAAVSNGRKILQVPFGCIHTKDFEKPREVALKWRNFKGGTDVNRKVFDDILLKYPEIKAQLDNEGYWN